MTGGVDTDFGTGGMDRVAAGSGVAAGSPAGSDAADGSSAGSAAAEALDDSNPGTLPAIAGRLTELGVHDLALIDRVRIAFEPGLNVLTGETGAGKSLLIDALGLAVGARADSSL
ncbi:MAG TPA: AAA family ATPase, partial [Candidatus Limnocylindrales bacterium]